MDKTKKLITVFTPAYNRADTIKRTYESLLRQTSKDFEWLIIDDGSTDNTEEVVRPWLDEQKIPVRYIKKANGGLFTAYNTAIEHINTELNVCVDSDDYMPDNAIEIIKRIWESAKSSDIAGIVGLDYYMNGGPIGGKFSKTGDFYYREAYNTIGHNGDTKVVCRTDLMKKIWPMPSFGEKNFNPTWFYHTVGETMKFRFVNECLCIVDYQPNGMSKGIFLQYKKSPRSFAELRRMTLKSKHSTLKEKFKSAIHLTSSSIFLGNWKLIATAPKPWLTLPAIPFGIALHIYICHRIKKIEDKKYVI